MHVLNYSSKAGGLNASRQLSNSDSRLPSRQDMPLPPLPTDPHQLPPFDPSAPPPLPARPTGMKHPPMQPMHKEGPPHHVVNNPPPSPHTERCNKEFCVWRIILHFLLGRRLQMAIPPLPVTTIQALDPL